MPRLFSLLVLLLAVPTATAVPPSDETPAAQDFEKALRRMDAVAGSLEAARFRFHKHEWVGGAMAPREVSEVLFRAPDDVCIVYVDGPGQGRRVVWQGDDWNKGRLRVDPGAWLPTLDLDPDGSLARRNNRYTIRDLPPTLLIEKIVSDAKRVNDHPSWRPDIQDLGTRSIHGETARCFLSELPKDQDSAFHGYKAEICVNETVGMPNSIRIWDKEDGEVRLVEDYQYVGFRPVTGVADEAFELENCR